MSGAYRYVPPQPHIGFTTGILAGFGALAGLMTAQGAAALMLPYMAFGAAWFGAYAFAITRLGDSPRVAGGIGLLVYFAAGSALNGFAYGVLMALVGYIAGRMVCWLHSGRYRLNLPPYATSAQVLWFYAFRTICGLIFVFLITPIIILIPLSFNVEPYFSFTEGMLSFDPAAYSLRWYWDILANGMVNPDAIQGWWSDMWNNAQWIRSIQNSFKFAVLSTLLATALGTLAAIGLSSSHMPYRRPIMALLISPMIVPLVITASGLAFFFPSVGLAKTDLSIVLAHAVQR